MTPPSMTALPEAQPLKLRWIGAIWALQLLAWHRVLRAPFVYDDRLEVVGNRTIRALSEWAAIGTYNTSRPILIATYALNWAIGGLDPLSYHLTTLAIHLLNTALAARLIGDLAGNQRIGLLCAAIWGLHPMTTEAVTYTTGRSDALCTTWILAALIAWVAHVRGSPRARWYGLAACAGGLLTKEVAFAIPPLLIAVELCLRPGPLLSRVDRRTHLPLWGLGAAVLLVRLATYGLPQPEVARPWWLQLGTQFEVWCRYLQLWLLPVGQSVLHDHPADLGPETVVAALLWASLAAIASLAALAWRRDQPLPALGLALWTLTLLPASAVPLKETMAEHRAYAGGIGLLLAAVGATRVPSPALPKPLLALPLLLAAATLARNEVWRSEIALWSDAASKNPQSVDAAYGAADAHRLAREWSAAEKGFLHVLSLQPDHVDARVNLGIVIAEQGRYPEAEARWKEALRHNPRSCAAHNNLGALSVRRGDLQDALREYISSAQWCPNDRIAHLALGDTFYQLGDSQKAIYHYRRFLEIAPDAKEAARAQGRLRLMER